jgi:hypothetical protein
MDSVTVVTNGNVNGWSKVIVGLISFLVGLLTMVVRELYLRIYGTKYNEALGTRAEVLSALDKCIQWCQDVSDYAKRCDRPEWTEVIMPNEATVAASERLISILGNEHLSELRSVVSILKTHRPANARRLLDDQIHYMRHIDVVVTQLVQLRTCMRRKVFLSQRAMEKTWRKILAELHH